MHKNEPFEACLLRLTKSNRKGTQNGPPIARKENSNPFQQTSNNNNNNNNKEGNSMSRRSIFGTMKKNV
jgi:hypothetical protein